jgi:serine/threonine protein kinase
MELTQFLLANGYSNIRKMETDRYCGEKNGNQVVIKVDVSPSEALALSELKSTEHVPHMLETLLFKNRQIIVLKFIEGMELNDLLESDLIPSIDKITVTQQLLDIIATIHKQGWIHGDIHTSNIIVDKKFKVKIIDFGTASKMSESDSLFVPLFPPPESLKLTESGKYIIESDYAIDVKYDYWALGLVLFRIFTDEPIPSASNFILEELDVIQYKNIYQPYSPRPEIPSHINKIIEKLLSHNPKQRMMEI